MDTSYRQIVKNNISFRRALNFLYLLGGMKIKVITINTGKQGWQKAKSKKKERKSERFKKKAAAALVKDKGTRTAEGLRGLRCRLLGRKVAEIL